MKTTARKSPEDQRLLLVESDHEAFAQIILLLEEAAPGRFTLDWAATGKFALSLMRRHRYEAILVRNGLGFQSGRELVESIRRVNGSVPLILLTDGPASEYHEAPPIGVWDSLDAGRMTREMLYGTLRDAMASRAETSAARTYPSLRAAAVAAA